MFTWSLFPVQNSSSLTIASCRCLFTAITDTFISVFDSSRVFVTDTELKCRYILYGSANFDVKFTNCTFVFNEQLVETEGGTVSIKGSRITYRHSGRKSTFISLSTHSYLYLENTIITNHSAIRQGFLIAEVKSYFRMTNCSLTMNAFATHFLIKDDSTMVVVDSVISENNFRVHLLDIAGSTCFLEGTSLNYNKLHLKGDLFSLVKLSVAKMFLTQCSVKNNVYMHSEEKNSFFLEGITSNVSIINSTITAMDDISGLAIIKLDSSISYAFTYLHLLNSNFNLKQTSVCQLTKVNEVIIENTNFYVETNITTMVDIADSEDVRIANSQFILNRNYDFACITFEAMSFRTQVLTLESNFSYNRHHFLSSKDKEFVKKAKDYKLISCSGDIKRYESHYASSKYDTSLTLRE